MGTVVMGLDASIVRLAIFTARRYYRDNSIYSLPAPFLLS